MNVEFTTRDGVLVAQVHERRLDAERAPSVKAVVAERVRSGSREILLDLSEVEFIDSTGLGFLLSLVKLLPPGGEIATFGLNASVESLFRLTRIDKVLTAFPAEAEALEWFATRRSA